MNIGAPWPDLDEAEARVLTMQTKLHQWAKADPGRRQVCRQDHPLQRNDCVRISMDGRGRWMDNIFIERLWRSLKYECIYLREMENGFQAQREIGIWMKYYNEERPHSIFTDDKTPLEVYTERMAA